ncbi:MAG: LLM class flavin-dependent oxidoreductase [Candidatus Lokiarchaeia archaeon]
MKLEFGVYLPAMLPTEMVKEWSVTSEKLGFDSIWISDHLMDPFPPILSPWRGCLEGWTAMSYFGGITKRVKLGHCVLIPDFKYPSVLAKMAATLDQLTNGRLILSLGAGWFRREFEAYGLPWDKHGVRIEREREAILVIKTLWTEEIANFDGKYYKLRDAVLEPKPIQTPHPPIWVGGDSPKTRELVAELADGWLMHGTTPDGVKKNLEALKQIGDNRVKIIKYATMLTTVMSSNREEANRKLEQNFPEEILKQFLRAPVRKEFRNRIAGSSEECIAQIEQYAEAGINHLILLFIDPMDTKIFADEVLPSFK